MSHKYKGLSLSEVQKLRLKYGYNEIKEKEQSMFVYFLKKFIEPIPLMIEIALVLSMIVKKWEDSIIILILLTINIIVGFIQERKANNALQSLKEKLAPMATVIRNNKIIEMNARDLVPGDIVKIGIGDIVPADIIILEKTYLKVDQSTITGESLPVNKNKGDIIYASSVIQKGLSLARVTATGRDMFIGKSADLVVQAGIEKESHFQKAIFNFGKFLIILSVVLVILSFVILIMRGNSIIETINFSLVLIIASVPVALPTVLSVTMAIGANKLAKKNAIVSNFKAIEELAGIDELCIDKTGTLTKNEIDVSSFKTYGNFNEEDLFSYALLAIGDEHKNSIEKAIYEYAKKHNLLKKAELYKIDKLIPFDPTRKMTVVSAHSDGNKINIVMGAPQVIVHKVNTNYESKNISNDINYFAKDGFRTLVIAKKIDNSFAPVGIISFLDPPRKDSVSVIAKIKKLGVNIKMLTGDNVAIASYIAKALNVGNRVIDSSILKRLRKTKKLSDDVIAIENANVFSEAIPEDKYHIVDILQKKGHIVAMTGDGVNDAPALKKADVGIAVAGASPAARSASDIVLLGNSLLIIKDAIFHARKTFSRMEAYATFRISETIRIIFFITLSVAIFNYSPLTAIMIILLALLNDIPVMAIAYDNAPVSKKPIRWKLKETIFISIILGMSGLLSSFFLFYWLNSFFNLPIAIIQTILFLKLDIAGHSTLYLTRTGQKHFWEKPFPSMKFFVPAFSSRIIGIIIAMYGILMEPIGWKMVLYVWIYATIWFLINDQIKVLSYKVLNKFKKSNN
ncbi:MAG: plasma-membrane proton-efflux P-type ATPase [Patescibacteria group bacterium]|jgi:H+-transporting ATPase|nr:plasma-membrane proton-efflux P-type ATPase [Patescibacteria group bacterium]